LYPRRGGRTVVSSAVLQSLDEKISYAAIELRDAAVTVKLERQSLQDGDKIGARHVGIELDRLRRRG
jgi:hypothetical protein